MLKEEENRPNDVVGLHCRLIGRPARFVGLISFLTISWRMTMSGCPARRYRPAPDLTHPHPAMAGMLDDALDHRAADQSTFAPFGTVIETEGATRPPINQGTTTRFDALTAVDVAAGGGSPHYLAVFMAPAAQTRSPSACSNAIRLACRPFIRLPMNGWLLWLRQC